MVDLKFAVFIWENQYRLGIGKDLSAERRFLILAGRIVLRYIIITQIFKICIVGYIFCNNLKDLEI